MSSLGVAVFEGDVAGGVLAVVPDSVAHTGDYSEQHSRRMPVLVVEHRPAGVGRVMVPVDVLWELVLGIVVGDCVQMGVGCASVYANV